MSDALDRLKGRKRPVVPSRDTVLDPGNVPESQSSTTQDISTTRYQNVEESRNLVTKQTTLRMESALSDRLQGLCREHKLSREVLIEAMFEHCEGDSDLMRIILENAQLRNEQRKQIANQKRASTMMKRFGS